MLQLLLQAPFSICQQAIGPLVHLFSWVTRQRGASAAVPKDVVWHPVHISAFRPDDGHKWDTFPQFIKSPGHLFTHKLGYSVALLMIEYSTDT